MYSMFYAANLSLCDYALFSQIQSHMVRTIRYVLGNDVKEMDFVEVLQIFGKEIADTIIGKLRE